MRPVCHAARRHLDHRQGLRADHDAVVPLPGHHGPGQHRRRRQRLPRAQPAAWHRVPVRRQPQPRRPHGAGQRLPVHHRRRGPLLRHGPRWQGQHLRLLALRQGVPDPQLPGTGCLDSCQQRQRHARRSTRAQPVLPDATRPDANLRRRPLHLRGDHRVPGAHHRLLLHHLGGHPPQPDAAHEDRLPVRDQGPDLHPLRQQRDVGLLHRRRAVLPDVLPHGSRLRPGHHRDHAHDDAAAVHLPLPHPQASRAGRPVFGLLRRDRAGLLHLEPDQVHARRLRHRPSRRRDLHRHVHLAPRHRNRAHAERLPAHQRVHRPALRAVARHRASLPRRQPGVSHQRLVARQARPRHPLLDPGQAPQARPRVLLPQRQGDRRALHARVHGQHLRHRLRLQGAAAPGLPRQPARQRVPLPGRREARRRRLARPAAPQVLDLQERRPGRRLPLLPGPQGALRLGRHLQLRPRHHHRQVRHPQDLRLAGTLVRPGELQRHHRVRPAVRAQQAPAPAVLRRPARVGPQGDRKPRPRSQVQAGQR